MKMQFSKPLRRDCLVNPPACPAGVKPAGPVEASSASLSGCGSGREAEVVKTRCRINRTTCLQRKTACRFVCLAGRCFRAAVAASFLGGGSCGCRALRRDIKTAGTCPFFGRRAGCCTSGRCRVASLKADDAAAVFQLRNADLYGVARKQVVNEFGPFNKA